jgi:hypothetical protein
LSVRFAIRSSSQDFLLWYIGRNSYVSACRVACLCLLMLSYIKNLESTVSRVPTRAAAALLVQGTLRHEATRLGTTMIAGGTAHAHTHAVYQTCSRFGPICLHHAPVSRSARAHRLTSQLSTKPSSQAGTQHIQPLRPGGGGCSDAGLPSCKWVRSSRQIIRLL